MLHVVFSVLEIHKRFTVYKIDRVDHSAAQGISLIES